MSVAAAEYYQQRAQRLDMDNLPGILGGVPVRLLDDEQRISFQRPDEKSLATVSERYGVIVDSLGEFVTAGHRSEFPGIYERHSQRAQNEKERHIDGLATTLLRPENMKVGNIRDIQTEAIARSEVDFTYIKRAAMASMRYEPDERYENQEVYLRTSAGLYSGSRRLGFVGCLSVIAARADQDHHGVARYTMHHMGTAFKQNDKLARSALEQARAQANFAVSWGLQNTIVNNVGRGKGVR